MSNGTINKVILLGRVGQTPQLRSTASGQLICQFSLATQDQSKGSDHQWHSQTQWHHCVLLDELAADAQHQIHKGDLLYLEGRIHTRSWQNKQQQKVSKLEILGSLFTLISKQQRQHSANSPATQPLTTKFESISNQEKLEPTKFSQQSLKENYLSDDDDLPF